MNSPFKTKYKQLQNGLKIYTTQYKGIQSVYLHAWVFVGSAYETEKNNGISHFLEHMMFRGNEKLGDGFQFNYLMEELGGELNAATSNDYTEYWIKVHRDFLEEGIRRFCQFLRFPAFRDLKIERKVISEEILSEYNEERQIIDIESLSARGLWNDHALGLPIIGNLETINQIESDELYDWFRNYYQPGNMIMGIAGDFDDKKAEEIIQSVFDQPEPSTRKRYTSALACPKPGQQLRFVFDKDNQFQIQWSFPIADLNPELKLSLQVINRLLDDGSSSRLQRIIREEKGLVYDISASLSYYDMGAVFNINTLVSTENLSALMDSLCHLVRDLCENGVLKSELDLVKKRYKTFLDCYLDNASGHLYEAVGHEIFPYFQDSKTILSSLDNLQLGQIKETLKTIFDQAQTYFVLVGPCTESIKDELSKYLAPWIEIPQED